MRLWIRSRLPPPFNLLFSPFFDDRGFLSRRDNFWDSLPPLIKDTNFPYDRGVWKGRCLLVIHVFPFFMSRFLALPPLPLPKFIMPCEDRLQTWKNSSEPFLPSSSARQCPPPFFFPLKREFLSFRRKRESLRLLQSSF